MKDKFLGVLLHTLEVAVLFTGAWLLIGVLPIPEDVLAGHLDALLGLIMVALAKTQRSVGSDYVNKV